MSENRLPENLLRVLIVDDTSAHREMNTQVVMSVVDRLKPLVADITLASSVEEMYEKLDQQNFQLILLDRCLGYTEQQVMIDGIEHIPQIVGAQPLAKLLIITSFHEMAPAVRAMQLGAFGFAPKPENNDEVQFRDEQIFKAIQAAQTEMELQILRAKRRDTPFAPIIYKSEAMCDLDRQLSAVAEYSTPVVLLGDSGLGKTHAAKRLNYLAQQRHGQKSRVFLNLNTSAIQPTLYESELFGFEKGAFTGANQRKLGYFELANDGDLFFDEIGDAPLDLQTKLLKVIEEREFKRIQGTQMLRTTARMIFATNKDLAAMVDKGLFRSDLYARITTFSLELPPLEKRKEDIPYICEQIILDLCKELRLQCSYQEFPPALQQYFHRDNIPGNIRGIQSDIHRLMILCPRNRSGKIDFRLWKNFIIQHDPKKLKHKLNDDLAHIRERPTNFLSEQFPGLVAFKKEVEKRLVDEAMRKFPTNKERAKALGVAESWFYNLEKRLNQTEVGS